MKDSDLRTINEREFLEIYEYLREKTKEFTEIKQEFLMENPQYLLILRLILGLSQKGFTEELGFTNKIWVRHFETGRQNFRRSKLIPKCIDVINRYFAQKKILRVEEAIKLWRRSQAAREKFFFKPEGLNYNIKKISQMDINDFKLYFSYLNKETENFTKFDPNILVNTPQFITVFRIILDLSHRSLAIALNKDPKTVRTHEYREYKLMPKTAKEIMELFERLFKDKEMIGNVNLEPCLEYFKRISYYDELEIEIENILTSIENNNLLTQKHVNIIVNTKTLNIDFIIYHNDKPLFAIEATKLKETRRKNITHRIAYIDHRFQIIKLKYPNINTGIIIRVDKGQEQLVKRIIERELINTNFCLVNNEIEKLSEIVKKFI